ncbi:MAG: LlaJI family restriction endonuclease, partial [Fusobacteriaceae bacterium]
MSNNIICELNIIFFIEEEYFIKSKLDEISKNEIKILLKKKILIENKNYELYFNYVGIISLKKYYIIVLPKIFSRFEEEKFNYGKFVYNILKKYSSEKKSLEKQGFKDDEEKEYFDKLPIYKYLIENFYENGLYEREKKIFEINGSGEICWENTIEKSEIFFDSDQTPFFTEMHTQKYSNEEAYHIKELHKFILNVASKYLNAFSKISDDKYNEIFFPVKDNLFSDKDFIIKILDRELNETFDEKKLNLLKTMETIVKEKEFRLSPDIYYFGTKSFYNVWEVALQEFFGHDKNNNLIKEFVPRWKNLVNGKTENGYPIIPDIIKIVDKTFYLFDAKYYDTDFTEDGIKNSQPKTYDIAKQFMYLECCKRLKDKDEIKYKYINAFLMPED